MTDFIAEHLARCRAANRSPNTIRDREELLRRVDADLPLGLIEATTEELQDWLSQPGRSRKRPTTGEDEGWSWETRANYYKHLVGFFTDMKEKIGWDPSAGLIRPKVPRGLPHPAEEEEVALALANLPKPWDLYVMLASHAGLRAAEVAGLHRQDITEARVLVDHGKGGKSRTIPTHPALWARIRLVPAGPIAMLGSGWVMTPDQMSSRVRYQLDKIGLPELTMHRFRHRFASMMLRPKKLGGAGADLLTVSILMGHADPKTTMVYCLITDEQREMAIRALPALVPVSR